MQHDAQDFGYLFLSNNTDSAPLFVLLRILDVSGTAHGIRALLVPMGALSRALPAVVVDQSAVHQQFLALGGSSGSKLLLSLLVSGGRRPTILPICPVASLGLPILSYKGPQDHPGVVVDLCCWDGPPGLHPGMERQFFRWLFGRCFRR